MIHAQEVVPSAPVVYDNLAFPDLPYPSRWIEVNGVRLHYIEGGDASADPILFLHGIPAWSYIWRDVMPVVEPAGRVIALDFAGFGRSDRPDITYDMATQLTYLEGFVEALDLHDITLVIQDLGSLTGFAYAAAHEENIKGIVFMEAAIPPVFSPDFVPTGPLAEFMASIQTLLQPGVGEEVLINQNAFIEQFLPTQVMRALSDVEMNAYRAPFLNPKDRHPILENGPRQFANPATFEMIGSYSQWLTITAVPMLHLYVTPGLLNPEASVAWSRTNISNIQQQAMGQGGHFFQEDYPVEIGNAIVSWLTGSIPSN